MQTLKAFRGSLAVSVIVLILVGVLSGSLALVATAAVLAVLEVTLSFDNAVVNAKYLKKMSPLWQKLFLTVGILIAVFGMRLVFPIVIVQITAGLGFTEVIDLALNDTEAYAEELEGAKAAIYAFGGIFLLMIFLDWVFEEKDDQVAAARSSAALEQAGKLDKLSVVIAAVGILRRVPRRRGATGQTGAVQRLHRPGHLPGRPGLDSFFEVDGGDARSEASRQAPHRRRGTTAMAVGKAGFSTFLYLEVLDASFSFDGVIGAFAISTDVLVIAAGPRHRRAVRPLDDGLPGAAGHAGGVRLPRARRPLGDRRAGGHPAARAEVHITEAITGLLGLAFILAAYASSISANRKDAAELLQDGLADDRKGIDRETSPRS